MSKYNINSLQLISKITVYIAVIFVVFSPIYLIAQDSLTKGFKKADSLYNSGNYEEAIPFFKQEMHAATSTKNWSLFMKSYTGVQKSCYVLNKFDYIDSLKVYYGLIPSSRHLDLGWAYLRVGILATNASYHLEAISEYEKALQNAVMVKDTSKTDLLNSLYYYSYEKMGNSYSQLEDQVSAIKSINDGIIWATSKELEGYACNFKFLKAVYTFYGGDVDRSILLYEDLIENCEEAYYMYQLQATAYLKRGDFKLASASVMKSQSILPPNDYTGIIDQYLLEARLAFFNKMYPEAKSINLKAIKLISELGDIRWSNKESIIYAEDMYEASFEEEAALMAHNVLMSADTTMRRNDLLSRPKLEGELEDVWIVEALSIKGRYFKDQFVKTSSPASLTEAEFYYDKLFEHFKILKSSLISDKSQYRIRKGQQRSYSDLVSFYTDLLRKGEVGDNFQKAFSFAQDANAFVLKNAVSELEAMQVAQVSSNTQKAYAKLKVSVKSNEDGDLTNLKKYKKFKDSLYQSHPSLLRYNDKSLITLKEAQSALNQNEILIKYFQGENELFRFTISNSAYDIARLPIDTSMDSTIIAYQTLLTEPEQWNEIAYIKSSSHVYNYLLGDILQDDRFSKQKELIIVPDGLVKKVSFSSLITNPEAEFINPTDYMVSDYAISHLYYCSQLLDSYSQQKNEKGFIGFGLEYDEEFLNELTKEYQLGNSGQEKSRQLSLAKLEFAGQEALSGANIMNGVAIVNKYLTLDTVLSMIHGFSTVHFSTHALIDPIDYLNSFIILNRGKNHEFKLTYEDILGLNVNSDLVVLSACQTGAGNSISGEGRMSLARAFVQSGAKAAIGSYWNAADKTTMKIMELFYQNINRSIPKSEALRQAQLTFLNDENLSSPRSRLPFYWSSWALYGNNDPINSTSSFVPFIINNKIAFLLILFGGFISVLFYFRFRSIT